MKTIIAGGRDITNFRYVCEAILASGWWDEITEVVSGRARGVDRLGELWADANGVLVKPFPYEMGQPEIYGKGAGRRRNRLMAEYAECLILVWNGSSPGSRSMKEIAEEKGLLICEYRVAQGEVYESSTEKLHEPRRQEAVPLRLRPEA